MSAIQMSHELPWHVQEGNKQTYFLGELCLPEYKRVPEYKLHVKPCTLAVYTLAHYYRD